MKTKQTKTAILLHNGDFFDFENPRNHNYDIKTIAHALSNLCRYTGHSKRFYSVAEHSVLVSRLVDPKFAFEGLMHDASEAYCGDVNSVLKRLIPEYRKIEDAVQEAIAIHFGLQFPFPEEVHKADKVAYVTERLSISNTGKDKIWLTEYEPVDLMIKGLTPNQAKAAFLERYEELTRNGKGYEVVRSKAAA